MTTARPLYKRDLCVRLRLAAEIVQKHPGAKVALEDAAQIILVFRGAQFPADFLRQWRSIIAGVTANNTVSIPEGIRGLTDHEVQSLGLQIVALYRDVCEPELTDRPSNK